MTIETKPLPVEQLFDPGPLANIAKAEAHRDEQILAQLPGREKLEREKERIAKLQADLERAEADRLAKYNAYQAAQREVELFAEDIARAQRHRDGAEYHIAAVEQTLADWFFQGGHPQMGKDSVPIQSIRLSAEAIGARFVVEAHARWLPGAEARLADARKRTADLAKELGLSK